MYCIVHSGCKYNKCNVCLYIYTNITYVMHVLYMRHIHFLYISTVLHASYYVYMYMLYIY